LSLVMLAAAAPAAADPLRTTDHRGRVTDWSTGQLIAHGFGVADRHAPSPAVAREAAQRRAIADATRELIDAAKALPLANGDPIGKVLSEAKLAIAATEATLVSAEPLVDGSWRVELGLPLEALRVAVDGPRQVPRGGDTGPAVWIIRAPAGMSPTIGIGIGDGKAVRHGATLWAKGSSGGIPLPAEALSHAPSMVAKRADGGILRVSRLGEVTDATLFVVVLGE
jgi:hypothetical protein